MDKKTEATILGLGFPKIGAFLGILINKKDHNIFRCALKSPYFGKVPSRVEELCPRLRPYLGIRGSWFRA